MKRLLLACGSVVACVGCLVACGASDGESGSGKAGSAGASPAAGAPAGGTTGASGAVGTAGAGTGTGTGGSGVAGSGTGGTGGSAGGASAGSAGAPASGGSGGGGGAPSKTTFFVTSDTSMTGKLGGLRGADARCQALAVKAGIGDHTFHAYLSAEHDPDDASKPAHARDRIGKGPWYNSAGVLLAQDLTALHALIGNADLFLDENKKKINGHWKDSPEPTEHDVLTGSTGTGMVQVGKTCVDWTSEGTTTAQVGHSDGLGQVVPSTPPANSWSSAHENGSCGNTIPKGGAGRLYCFAIN